MPFENPTKISGIIQSFHVKLDVDFTTTKSSPDSDILLTKTFTPLQSNSQVLVLVHGNWRHTTVDGNIALAFQIFHNGILSAASTSNEIKGIIGNVCINYSTPITPENQTIELKVEKFPVGSDALVVIDPVSLPYLNSVSMTVMEITTN